MVNRVVVVLAGDSPLHQSPEALDGVRVNLAVNVGFGVIDASMAYPVADFVVASVEASHQYRTRVNVAA